MFEYMIVSRYQSIVPGEQAETDMLNHYGTKGWELTAVRMVNSGGGIGRMIDLYYFKRAVVVAASR